MRLMSLEAASRNSAPIILWLQEVDEQVRTNSGVKAGGFLPMTRKFNTICYVEVLLIDFSIVDFSITVWDQGLILNFLQKIPDKQMVRS